MKKVLRQEEVLQGEEYLLPFSLLLVWLHCVAAYEGVN